MENQIKAILHCRSLVWQIQFIRSELMRKFAKISAVLAAMVLALAFAGCKSDDDDDDPSVVTTWSSYDSSNSSNRYDFYFYDDNTFKSTHSVSGITYEHLSGTYTGDTTKDGKIKAKCPGFEFDFTIYKSYPYYDYNHDYNHDYYYYKMTAPNSVCPFELTRQDFYSQNNF